MNLIAVQYSEYGSGSAENVTFKLDPQDLSVEEFTNLRVLIDLSGILADDVHCASPAPKGGQDISITVETASEGIHQASFQDAELPSEYQELAECIKDLGRVHKPPVLAVNRGS